MAPTQHYPGRVDISLASQNTQASRLLRFLNLNGLLRASSQDFIDGRATKRVLHD